MLNAAAPGAAANASANQDNKRELTGIADEQELLRRQLQRLRRTMEGLIPRLEKEGRAHALQLLREGLRYLDDRPEDARSQTLEEMMDGAKAGIESGQAVLSLEQQERIVVGLERLLAILMNRESLDSLEDALEELHQ